VALITLRTGEVGVDVVAGGALVFSRGASVRAEAEATKGDLPPPSGAAGGMLSTRALEPAAYLEAATIEVVRSLHSYGGMEMKAAVTHLLIAGATGREQELSVSLHEKLQVPCSLLDPVQALDLPEAARERAADAVGAIGLGLAVNDPDGLPFDFLHPKRTAVQRNMRRTWTLGLCAAGATLLIVLLGIRSHLVNKRMKIYRSVQAELTAAEKKVPIYRRAQLQEAAVQNWTKEGRNWLEHLAYLSAVLPATEDLYITSLSVSGQGNLHLAVQAKSGDVLANLDRQLRAAGYQVKPLAITPGSDKFGYSFRSTVELIIPPKMKIELSKVQVPSRPADDGSLDGKTRPGRKGGRS
jgi:hypothetical protein